MTRSGKSRAAVLTGVLVLVVAVALPLLPAFGEGGARRDGVRHAAECNAATTNMLYLVEFEATQAGAPTSREQTIETFAQRAEIERKVVQGLRTQK